jgi:uncharacterized protein (UPF0210 family)
LVKQKIYDKILRYAKNHVKNAYEIEKMFGIRIANKRVSVTPISVIADSFEEEEIIQIAEVLDKVADEIGIDYIAGYSALVQKGFTNGEYNLIKSIPKALAVTKKFALR